MKRIPKIFIGVLTFAAVALSAFAPTLSPKAKLQTQTVSAASSWVDTLAEPTDYAYSFAVVGDTQYLTNYDMLYGTDYLQKEYKWIADNAAAKKMKQVIGVGDITHYDDQKEWQLAAKAISQLDGKVQYSLVRGNHDNRYTFFDYYYGVDTPTGQKYMAQCVDYFTGDGEDYRARNTAQVFTGGNVDYLMLSLDFGAEDDVLEWANEVVESYPNHTVIISTHGYLSAQGERLAPGIADSPSSYNETYRNNYNMPDIDLNDGVDMWDLFIRKHKNISMVFSGHVLNTDIVHSKTVAYGDNGNLVQEIMVNPQSHDDDNRTQSNLAPWENNHNLTGMVAIFYCSADGQTMDVQWYSTVKNKFYIGETNQFTLSNSDSNTANDLTVATKSSPYAGVRAQGGGTVSPAGKQMLTAGTPITYTFTPDKYYKLGKVLLNGTDITSQVQNNSYTLTDTSKHAHFVVDFVEENRYYLYEQNDLTMGRITFVDTEVNATYAAGDTLTFTVDSLKGYAVDKVTFNGTELTKNAAGKYTATVEAKDNILVVEYLDLNPPAPPTPSTPSNPTTPETPDSSVEDSSSATESSGAATGFGCMSFAGLGGMTSLLLLCGVALTNKKNKNLF